MQLFFSALEFAPYVTETPAAESIALLARALSSLGHEVTVVVPKRPEYEEAGLLAARRLSPLDPGDGSDVHLFNLQLPSGVQLVQIDLGADEIAGVAALVDESLSEESARALSRFSGAVAGLCRERADEGSAPQVLVGHDFGGGLALAALANQGPATIATVLSVHDASRVGAASVDQRQLLGLSEEDASSQAFGSGQGLSLLKGLVSLADQVVTPSPAYAATLCAPEQHGALSRAFAAAQPEGIVEGVDMAVFNPATDAAVKTRFDAAAPEKKGINRTATLRDLELSLDASKPLFLVEAGQSAQTARSTLIGSLPALVRQGVQLVVSDFGEATAQELEVLEPLQESVRWVSKTSSVERRRLLAAADFYLCLERQNPAARGLLQAARYGAIPVAFAADAAPDVIVDCDAELATGTGVLFDSMTQRSVTGAVGRAVAAFKNPGLMTLIKRVMRQDLAWDRPARRHAQVMQAALARHH